MPETIRRNSCTGKSHEKSEYLFGKNCLQCGSMVCYADDTTYAFSSKSRSRNQEMIVENMENVKNFLMANKLCINEKKTSILETMNFQKRCKTKGNPPGLMGLDEDDNPIWKTAATNCRLLGANIGRDLSWKSHLMTGEKPVFPALRRQLGILAHVSKNIPQRSRKIIAEGIVLSKLKYLLPLWGGAGNKYHKKAQIIINKAARSVTGRGRRASARNLLIETGWMSSRELVKYFTLLEMWRTVHMGVSSYLCDKINWDEDLVVTTPPGRLQMTRNSYRWRACTLWNSQTEEIRKCQSIKAFKKQIKINIINQRPPVPGTPEDQDDSNPTTQPPHHTPNSTQIPQDISTPTSPHPQDTVPQDILHSQLTTLTRFSSTNITKCLHLHPVTNISTTTPMNPPQPHNNLKMSQLPPQLHSMPLNTY